jgi:polysaccharide export outer membrane protein
MMRSRTAKPAHPAARATPAVARRNAVRVACAAVIFVASGCDYDSWMDPSRTGYFEHTPTSIPILRKIDVIEVEQDAFATEIGAPVAADLIPGNSEYIFASGDGIEVQINDLFQVDKAEQFRRTVDQSGKILLPIVGSIEVAGKSQSELVAAIEAKLKPIIRDPRVDVTIVEGRAFTFTVDGQVRNSGVYALQRPDFDIEQAVALAGGANEGVRRIRVVRTLITNADDAAASESSSAPGGNPPSATAPTTPVAGPAPATAPATAPADSTAPSVDDLLKQIQPPAANVPAEPSAPAPAPAPASASPGALRSPAMVVDVDQLEAPKVAETAVVQTVPDVQTPPTSVPATESRYVFDTQKQEWVYVSAGSAGPASPDVGLATPNSPDGAITGPAAFASEARPLKKGKDFRLPNGKRTRVILVDWAKLQQGDLTQNVLVRPGDKIHVESDIGVVYIDGEIARPGVYNLPPIGELTLSRLVSAAGGLGQIAIPQRVDLIRKIAPDREAAIRVNLAAIRNKAEPDIVMRADDHIIIGTNFFATPLAVIRNGFRMTYGFGFLIDRNFGNDVFGPPPFSQQNF